MENKQIIFTKVNTAELLEVPLREPLDFEVMVKTEFSTISPGTEKANITGDPNVGVGTPSVVFPRTAGYSSAGTVIKKGAGVRSVEIGDKVVVYWGKHCRYNTVPEQNVVKIPEGVGMQEAAVSFIATFPLAAIRKTRCEIGEPAVVMGQGLLGQLAVKLLRAAGAMPVVAVDPIAERRAEALAYGADYVFDPFEENFAEKVKKVTGGGAKVAIEVTGVGAGFDGVLDCMARFGRVALLGCTRDKNFTIDYYRKIHFPGITVIGAHTEARPDGESHPGWFTHRDDISVALGLCAGGRLDIKEMIKEIHSPGNCFEVFKRLAEDKKFPAIVQFDWSELK